MTAIRTAVILAAGMGTRLKDYTEERPKGFLEIDGSTLIDRSIKALLDHGITNIIIGTGHFHEQFDLLKGSYPGITTMRNVDYAVTGSMYTLYVVRELIKDSFLLLESDLLYDQAALDLLLLDAKKDIVLASSATNSGDEVYIQHSPKAFLENMSKDKTLLSHIDGELVGISKLSRAALNAMIAFAEPAFDRGSRKMNYEDAMVGAASNYNIFIKVIQDLAWCEIDDENHLARALATVYPKILERMNNP
ncbi:MAG: phosphocholine cytidylyltransferase family protein [Chryseolinea sp.]